MIPARSGIDPERMERIISLIPLNGIRDTDSMLPRRFFGWKKTAGENRRLTPVPPEKSIRQASLAFQGFPEHTLSGRKTFLIITQRGLEWGFQRNSPISVEFEPIGSGFVSVGISPGNGT